MAQITPIYQSIYSSDIGDILLIHRDEVLYSLDFVGYEERMLRLLAKHIPHVDIVEVALPAFLKTTLDDYFAGNHAALDQLTIDPGGTDFQREVWAALRKVPFATTTTYSGLAQTIGRPKAVRAVANANANNPIAIVLPCHRVIGKNGALTGYAGGLPRKEKLLAHEQMHAQ